MATNTVTRASVLATALELEGVWNAEELEVLQKMYASITKPRKKSDEPTKAQLVNANLAAELVKIMRSYGEPVTAKWIAENVNGIMTPQKAVAIIKAAGPQIVKFYEGRQAMYRLA